MLTLGALVTGILGVAVARLPRHVALVLVLTPLLAPVFFGARYSSHMPVVPYAVREETPRTAVAMLRRARERECGIGCLARPDEANLWYERAVATGDALALYRQAIRIERGVNVPRDQARAAALYRASALAGNREAMLHLASMLEDGRGVPVDAAEAAALRDRAAR